MQMRPDIQIQSAIKALTDVVLPAIDPTNKLAQEQIALTIGLLSVMRQQLPLQFRFDRDELNRLLTFVASLEAAGEADACLAAQIEKARDVFDRALADPQELVDAVRALREATGAVITNTYKSNDRERIAPLERAVLAMSSEQLLRERAWFRSQNWEPADGVPEIERLLGSTR